MGDRSAAAAPAAEADGLGAPLQEWKHVRRPAPCWLSGAQLGYRQLRRLPKKRRPQRLQRGHYQCTLPMGAAIHRARSASPNPTMVSSPLLRVGANSARTCLPLPGLNEGRLSKAKSLTKKFGRLASSTAAPRDSGISEILCPRDQMRPKQLEFPGLWALG